MSIIEDFDRKASLYGEFSDKLQVLLAELLSDKGLRVHSVATRPKSRHSFEKKLGKEVGKYSCLEQITDLCAARITTYMEEEVDAVRLLRKASSTTVRIRSTNESRPTLTGLDTRPYTTSCL